MDPKQRDDAKPKRKYVKKVIKPYKQIVPKEPKERSFIVTFKIF
jgi:hypothetical protein